jgi:hypothetical protein
MQLYRPETRVTRPWSIAKVPECWERNDRSHVGTWLRWLGPYHVELVVEDDSDGQDGLEHQPSDIPRGGTMFQEKG